MRKIIFLIPVLFLTNACIETAIVGTATTAGAVVVQERTAGKAVDDTTIFWKIKGLYLGENTDLLSQVAIEVIEGRVHLTGSVNNDGAKAKAVSLAWKPEGVREVIDEINVVEGKTLKGLATSEWIQSQVISRLILEKGVRSANYSVEVVDSVVYIMGIAQSNEELEKVTTIASRVKGVKRVVNHAVLKDDSRRGKE
jgi:osmotically-inducible protein OsmY